MNLRMVVGAAVGIALGAGASVQAELTTFVIDPGRSTLNFSGSLFSQQGMPLPFAEQSPGSLTTNLSGTVVADLLVTTIELTGGAMILADNGDWLPGGTAGNFGFEADSGSPDLIGSMTGAMRGASFSLISSAIATTPAGSGFSFPIGTAVMTGLTGAIDFDGAPPTSVLGALAGVTESLVGVSPTAWAAAVADATYETDGVTETLTIPVDAHFENFVPTAELDFHLDGTVVATRTIPEPATALLLLAGALTILRRRS